MKGEVKRESINGKGIDILRENGVDVVDAIIKIVSESGRALKGERSGITKDETDMLMAETIKQLKGFFRNTRAMGESRFGKAETDEMMCNIEVLVDALERVGSNKGTVLQYQISAGLGAMLMILEKRPDSFPKLVDEMTNFCVLTLYEDKGEKVGL